MLNTRDKRVSVECSCQLVKNLRNTDGTDGRDRQKSDLLSGTVYYVHGSCKNLIKKKIAELALEKLNMKKEGHSTMANLEYTSLEMQEYLKDKQNS